MKKKLLILSLLLLFPLTSCLNKDSNHKSSESTIIPSSIISWDSVVPSVPEEDLIGSADPSIADAIINLKGETAIFDGKNVKITENDIYGTIVEIIDSGTYVIQGTLNQGFVAVARKELQVYIILNGVNIYATNYAPLVCTKKSEVVVELAADSTNYLTDGSTYNYTYDIDHEPNACLYIRKDLTLIGEGKLIVSGQNNNGISTKGNLHIQAGQYVVKAMNNGIKGNDSIKINDGTFNIESEQDGIKSDNEEDESGYIDIKGGSFIINTNQDGIEAFKKLTITNAHIVVKTAGGSNASLSSESAKGLKGNEEIKIESGNFEIDSNDDALHSNGIITIDGGAFNISTRDDGIHADSTININDGNINIIKSYEGIEGEYININGGLIKVVSSDDGINISNGVTTTPGGGGGKPGGGGGGQSSIAGTLTINGGTIYMDASGDGLDSNGNIIMNGGLVIVHGPTSNNNGSVDYDGSFKITGGTLVALGSSGMAQQPGTTSTQYTVLLKFSNASSASKLLCIKNSENKELITVSCVKSINSMVFSSPDLMKGSYTLSIGGNYSTLANDVGIYENGNYSGGSVLKNFTINNITTTVN